MAVKVGGKRQILSYIKTSYPRVSEIKLKDSLPSASS